MTARVWILGLGLLALAACAPLMEEPVVVEEAVVLEEPAVIEAAPITRCGDEDDGIGGTGCAVD